MAGRMGESDGDAVVLDGAVGGVVTTAVEGAEGAGAAVADAVGVAGGPTGLEGASMTGAVGGSTLGSHPMRAMAATDTSAADESPARRLASGAVAAEDGSLVPQKTQAASFERT
jgi:hypothetical protein